VNLLSLAQFALVPSCAARIQGIKLTKVSQLSLSETRVDWRRLATLARSGATNRVTTEGARNSCDFNARVRFLSLSVEGAGFETGVRWSLVSRRVLRLVWLKEKRRRLRWNFDAGERTVRTPPSARARYGVPRFWVA